MSTFESYSEAEAGSSSRIHFQLVLTEAAEERQ
jgi:hypothetical protein